MRREPCPFRLSFLLPSGADPARAGKFRHALAACEVTLHAAGLVVIKGLSREAVLASAGELLRQACRGLPPLYVHMNLVTARDAASGLPSGRDTWLTIIGADVAFVPTAQAPVIHAIDLIADRLISRAGEAGSGYAQPPPALIDDSECVA